MTAPTVHRVWKIGTVALLLLMSLHLTLNGFFKPRAMLTDQSRMGTKHAKNGRKVIYMLFDALREDFIEWPEETALFLESNATYSYTDEKITVFNRLVEEQPQNTLMFPLRSEMPTVTTVRIKGFLSGIITTVFEFTENIIQGIFTEDNILSLLRRKIGQEARIRFYGDDIWVPMFGQEFTTTYAWPSHNVADLDTLDQNVSKQVLADLKAKEKFDFMLVHMIGLDCAGHTYGSRSPQIERKLDDTEKFIEEVIRLMDQDTTLVIFGDHGMTEEGNHGGDSLLEMRTAVFAYQKKPFPLGKIYRDNLQRFNQMDKGIKQADLAAIGAILANVPFPFSNLGAFHPAFAQTSQLSEVITLMRENIDQIDTYLKRYCQETQQPWCEEEIQSFASELRKLDSKVANTNAEKIEQLEAMTDFLNEKYDSFKKIWIEFDKLSMQVGVALAAYLFLFHLFVSFSKSQHYQDFGGIVGLSVSCTLYGAALLGMLPVYVPAGACVVISWNQCWRQRNEYLKKAYQSIKRSNMNPKGLVYPSMTTIIVLSFIVSNASDRLLQEQDSVIDSLLLLCLAFMWVTQPAHLRHRDVANYVVIVFCIKVTYLCDNQRGLNEEIERELVEAKAWFQTHLWLTYLVPLFFCIFLENKISRHYSFGMFHNLQAHALTAMLLFNFTLTFNPEALTQQSKATKGEQVSQKVSGGEMATLIGNMTYLAVATSLIATTIYVKFMLKKSWDNVSVRCGCLLLKAAMLVSGEIGPIAYFCMLLQVYNFALIINKRRDSRPGASFTFQVLFTFLSMTHYFLRTNHRERVNSIKLGKVCPGAGDQCSPALHYSLLAFEMMAPYLIGHMILPLTVKARVLNAYAHLQKKDDDHGRPVMKKASKKVSNADNTVEKVIEVEEDKPLSEFIGNMPDAMSIIVAMMILQVVTSCAFVLVAHQELIFPERVAPKFVFDICRSIMTLAFGMFWM